MVTRIGPKKLKPRRIYLAEWREHRLLTQRQLADRLDTTEATISRYESLKRDPTLGFLEAAAEALRCSVSDILDRPPPDDSALPPADSDDALINQIAEILGRRVKV